MGERHPLDGLRVLDLTTMISGGFATVLLADFGAEVLSVEHPTKTDPLREWVPQKDGASVWWKSLGRNKRHLTLDLSTEDGQALARDLAADADILVENFRPGTLERWNLGPETLQETNEGLVIVRLSGYGQTGPKSARPGFGTVAEGFSTWANTNGFPDREPLLPPIPLSDLTAGMFAALGGMFGVYERDVGDTDKGEVVDVSLYEPLFRLFVSDVETYDLLGEVHRRHGNQSVNAAPRNLYETSDGYLSLSASAQRIFENVMEAIDRPDLIDDPRFVTNERRLENNDTLDRHIESWTIERTRDDALRTLHEHDAIVGPIYDMSDVFADDHYAARDDTTKVADDELGEVRTVSPVPKFSRRSGRVDSLGGAVGADNEAVYLDEMGLSREEYERLESKGVV